MNTYKLVGIVERTLTDTVKLTIEADGEDQACITARKVLQTFPDEHSEKNVPFCYIDSRDYGPSFLVDISTDTDTE